MANGELLDGIAAAQREHYFRDITVCACGFAPNITTDWHRHLADVSVLAVARWFRRRASPTLAGDPFVLASEWAASAIEEDHRGR